MFCDLGTPSQYWNVYDELRAQLTAHGMPHGAVRFAHEAKTDAEKARLFAACRSGEVAVLVGSTAKMGVGTNVQARAIALHHLDCPWRPADLQQRDGRIMRQGNLNPEVSIHRWVVEGSFDAYSWQTVERKARFIAQIMRGRLDVREIEDIGDSALSFAEVKALASGDSLVLEREKALAEVTKLERLDRAWHRNQNALAATIRASEQAITDADRDLPRLHAAADRTTPTAGEAFTMTVAGEHHHTRVEAASAISDRAPSLRYQSLRRYDTHTLGPIGAIGGHTLTATTSPRLLGREEGLTLHLDDVPRIGVHLTHSELRSGGVGLVRRIEALPTRIPETIDRVHAEREAALTALDQARAAKDRPFKHAQALAEARSVLARIHEQMAPPQTGTQVPTGSSAPGQTDPVGLSAAAEDSAAATRARRPLGVHDTEPEQARAHTSPGHVLHF